MRKTARRAGLALAAGALAAAGTIGVVLPSAAEPAGPGAAAQPNVVGGESAKVSEHQYVVYLEDRRGKHVCGGALVAPDKVVTAAHCVSHGSPSRVTVVAGRQDVRKNDGTEADVERIWIPEEYSRVSEGNDIAVLELDEKLPYRTIRYATKDDGHLYQPGRKATVYGWGDTSEGGNSSNTLRSASLPIRSDSVCDRTYTHYEPDQMVCAGHDEGGVDACHGDSGGPLVTGGRLVGVVSWGEGCAREGKPGVYTEVREFAGQIAKSEELPSGGGDGGSGLPIIGG